MSQFRYHLKAEINFYEEMELILDGILIKKSKESKQEDYYLYYKPLYHESVRKSGEIRRTADPKSGLFYKIEFNELVFLIQPYLNRFVVGFEEKNHIASYGVTHYVEISNLVSLIIKRYFQYLEYSKFYQKLIFLPDKLSKYIFLRSYALERSTRRVTFYDDLQVTFFITDKLQYDLLGLIPLKLNTDSNECYVDVVDNNQNVILIQLLLHKYKQFKPNSTFLDLLNKWTNCGLVKNESLETLPETDTIFEGCNNIKQKIFDVVTILSIMHIILFSSLENIKSILLLVGRSDSGKTLFVNLLRALNGGSQQVYSPSVEGVTNRFQLHPLDNKQMIVFNDFSKSINGKFLDLIKQLTGSDSLYIERKFENDRKRLNFIGNLILVSNNKISFEDENADLVNRQLILNFMTKLTSNSNEKLLVNVIKNLGKNHIIENYSGPLAQDLPFILEVLTSMNTDDCLNHINNYKEGLKLTDEIEKPLLESFLEESVVYCPSSKINLGKKCTDVGTYKGLDLFPSYLLFSLEQNTLSKMTLNQFQKSVKEVLLKRNDLFENLAVTRNRSDYTLLNARYNDYYLSCRTKKTI